MHPTGILSYHPSAWHILIKLSLSSMYTCSAWNVVITLLLFSNDICSAWHVLVTLSLSPMYMCHGERGARHFPCPGCLVTVIKPITGLVTDVTPFHHSHTLCKWDHHWFPLSNGVGTCVVATQTPPKFSIKEVCAASLGSLFS